MKQESQSMFGQEAVEQISLEMFKVAFRNVFRALSSEYTTVLFMDDLQWADKESLVLFMTMLEDEVLQQQPFLFIGAHRPLTDEQSVFAFFRPTIQKMSLEEVQLGNLNPQGVNAILGQLFRLEKDDTLPLAQVIHSKTKGHPIFVIAFLRIAAKCGFLTRDPYTFLWEFDLQSISTKMDLADNVADVLVEKVQSLSGNQRLVLVLAAALGGFTFEKDVMEQVLSAHLAYYAATESQEEKEEQDYSAISRIEQDLSELEAEGFLRCVGPGQYRFSHDKIREAGHSLLPEQLDERRKVFLCLGRQLQKMMTTSEQKQSALIFQTVCLLNQARSLIGQSTIERKQLAELNYQAAVMASDRSSFFPASEFLEIAVVLLSPSLEEAWKEDYDRILRYSNLRITVEFQCGRLDRSKEIADVVLHKATDFEEKQHAYFQKLLALMQKGEGDVAKKVAQDVLKSLGYALPKVVTPFHIMQANSRLNKLLKSKTDDDLVNLPLLKDPKTLSTMQFLERLAELCFTSRTPGILRGVLCLHGPLTMTLEKGHSPMSSMAFVYFGMINSNMGNHDQSHRFGLLGLRYINAHPGLLRYDGRATNLYYWFIHHWRNSYQSAVEPLGKVLQQYWQKGIMENYFIDSHFYLYYYFCAGLKLGALEQDIRKIAGQMRENGRLQALHNEAPLFQFVSKMTDLNADPTNFAGEYYEEKLGKEWARDGNTQPLMRMRFFHMIYSYYFHQYDEANSLLEKLWPDEAMGAMALVEYQAFFRAMVTFEMAQRTRGVKKWVLKWRGKLTMRKMRAWVQNGNVNAHHLLQLLEAEYRVVKGAKPGNVKAAFDKAISSAARLGFLNSRALGNERACMYCLQHGYVDWACTYFEAAMESYEDWGALSKAHHLLAHYKKRVGFVALNQGDKASRGVLARTRLQVTTRLHHSLPPGTDHDIAFKSTSMPSRLQGGSFVDFTTEEDSLAIE